jgi:hypothetical protein
LEAQKVPGSIVELPFGDPPEAYSLTAAKDRPKADCVWTLYRGDGASSMLEWSHLSNDSESVHGLIANHFPGWVLKGKMLQDPVSSTTSDQHQTTSFQTATGNNNPIRTHRSTLEGDLQNMQVPNLLQSIGMGKLTGRLEITSRTDTATLFFAEGIPLHGSLRGAEGDNAVIELISWEEGQFHFYPEPKTDKKTIHKRLEFLIMEGCTFQDQQKSLLKNGLTMDAVLVRKHASLSEKEFEDMVSKGAPVDMGMQKRLYVATDNKTSLFEILRSTPLQKVEWVPLLFNLLTCGLIEFRKISLQTQTTSHSKLALVDWTQVKSAEKLLTRGDTGLYTYPAFLYFVDKEFCRYDRFDRPFSVVIFSIGIGAPDLPPGAATDSLEPLPARLIKTMGERIARIKRQVDLLAHFQILYFALLLPETNRHQAQLFSTRLNDILRDVASSEPIEGNININIGLASLPEDTTDLDELLHLAKPTPAG